jgi:hypothetical protein
MARNSKDVSLDALERIKIRRRVRKPTRSDVSLHPAAGAAYSVWKSVNRLFPRYALLSEEATRFAICRVPMQVKRRGKNTWWVISGFEAFDELQELETSEERLPVQLQEYVKITDPQVEAVSLIFLLHALQNYALDWSVALEQVRRLIKTGFSRSAQDLVLAATTCSQVEFAQATGIGIGIFKRQARRLKGHELPDSSFLAQILAK